MNKVLSLAAVAVLSLAGAAHAATVDVNLGTTSSDLSYSTSSVAQVGNIDLGGPGTPALVNAAIVGAGSNSSGNYASPTGSIYANTYLAIFGTPVNGTATFTLGASQNTFGFTWGSIDAYNSLTLTDSRGVSYSITGSEILAQIAGSVAGSTQSDVLFTDKLGTIVTAQLTSIAQNSFEAANFSQNVSSVPLPASFPLFAAAMVAMFFVAKRKNNKA